MKKRKKELTSLIISKTLIFLVIVMLVSIFKSIFGDENTLVGVTSIVLMLSMLPMDLTIHPLKNLLGLVGLNLFLGLSAFLVSQNIFIGLALNFAIMAFIGYYFTYELRKPINMLVGLHYILMISNPIAATQLPVRLLALVTGAFMIMGIQLLVNRNKLVKAKDKILDNILATMLEKVDLIKSNTDTKQTDIKLDSYVNQLKSLIFDSGKSNTHLTECGHSTINILSCFEKINTLLNDVQSKDIDSESLECISNLLENINDEKLYIEIEYLESKYSGHNLDLLDIDDAMYMYEFISTIKTLSTEMHSSNNINNIKKESKEGLPLSKEFKNSSSHKRVLNVKSTRFAYGLRLGVLVSLTFLFVDFFNTQYGEWIVYTVFALSQPHLEYTITKSKKRIIGTLLGAVIIAVLFNLVTDPLMRTLILVLSGYLMSYVSDYRNTVIFVTICSIASAGLNVANPNAIIVSRVLFIFMGIIISLIASKYIFSHNLLDEENNLNTINKDASRKMLGEILLNNSINKDSSTGILYLVPSLVDLRISHLKNNGLDIDKSLINRNKSLTNDLYQIYLLKKHDADYNNILDMIKEFAHTSTSLDLVTSKVSQSVANASTIKEKFILSKINSVLTNINYINYNEKDCANLDQYLTVFN